MSEERLEQDQREDEDVEAHKRRSHLTDDAPKEQGDEENDDVEAHRRRSV